MTTLPPVFFLSAHQDDETLWAGRIIAHHVLAGRDVHVVCMTTGENTGVRDQLNGVGVNGWWNQLHVPTAEGYTPLSLDDTADARDVEQGCAVAALGVPNPVVTPDCRPADGLLTVDFVRAYAESLADEWPGVDIWTHHPQDSFSAPHPDHVACGQAMAGLYHENGGAAGPFGATRFFLRPELATSTAPVCSPHGSVYNVPSTYLVEVEKRNLNATRCYGAWAPLRGSFAVGMHSVPGYFVAAAVNLAHAYSAVPLS